MHAWGQLLFSATGVQSWRSFPKNDTLTCWSTHAGRCDCMKNATSSPCSDTHGFPSYRLLLSLTLRFDPLMSNTHTHTGIIVWASHACGSGLEKPHRGNKQHGSWLEASACSGRTTSTAGFCPYFPTNRLAEALPSHKPNPHTSQEFHVNLGKEKRWEKHWSLINSSVPKYPKYLFFFFNLLSVHPFFKLWRLEGWGVGEIKWKTLRWDWGQQTG